MDRLILTESLSPGFGIEELMNPPLTGYRHCGFKCSFAVTDIPTAGKEEAYLLPHADMMSLHAMLETPRLYMCQAISAPKALRAGFEHHGRLLEGGNESRKRLPTPIPPATN